MKTAIVFFATLSALADSTKAQNAASLVFDSIKSETEDQRIHDYKIDNKYFAGNYLIYDCEENHFACVNDVGYAECNDNREAALKKKSHGLPCAALKIFLDKKTCIEQSYQYVDRNNVKLFCFSK